MQANSDTPAGAPPAERQVQEPDAVTLKGRRTLLDADVKQPLLWGDDEQQRAALAAIRGAGL
jgi:hypothetical protein